MAGLGPAIHDFQSRWAFLMDARPKAGHDAVDCCAAMKAAHSRDALNSG
jgi:hypothetical protein